MGFLECLSPSVRINRSAEKRYAGRVDLAGRLAMWRDRTLVRAWGSLCGWRPALVQSRQFQKDDESIRNAIRFNTIDVAANLSVAFLINAAILVLAALVFYGKTSVTVAGGQVIHFNDATDWIQAANLTLAPLLGTTAASILFAIALLASGQSATIVGTMAGQVVMEGFMQWKIAPWLRRMITRSLAIIPTVIFIAIRGANNVNDLIVLSQVVLALQLPFAMFPLLHFASSRKRMGQWRLGWFLLIAGLGFGVADYGL